MIFTSFQVPPGATGKIAPQVVASENPLFVQDFRKFLKSFFKIRYFLYFGMFFALPAVLFPVWEFHLGVESLNLCFLQKPLHLVASERAKNTTLFWKNIFLFWLYFCFALPAASFPAREFHPGVASLSLCFIAMSYLCPQPAIQLSRCYFSPNTR